MNDYNLTWEEAKEAMKRGAICGENIRCSTLIYRINNSHFQCKIENGTWVKAAEYGDKVKWRIVELTDCNIRHGSTDLHGIAFYTCINHAPMAIFREKPQFFEIIKTPMMNYCIKKFTEQLKEDMKIKEQKMRDSIIATYSVEEVIAGARNGKFYKVHSILNSDNYNTIGMKGGEILQYSNNGKVWCDIKLLGRMLINKRYIEVENPEKKEPEIKVNEFGFIPYNKNAYDNDQYILHIQTSRRADKICYQERVISEKWQKAISTFLQLKSHPLAVKPDYEEEQFYIGANIEQELVISLSCDYAPDKPDYLSPMFSCEEDANKAIEDIGGKNLVEMFKVFSGDYE